MVIAAMLRSSSGRIWVGGIEVTARRGKSLDAYRRSHVGVVHQAHNLIPSLNALENVTVHLALLGVWRSEARERAENLLNEVGMNWHPVAPAP